MLSKLNQEGSSNKANKNSAKEQNFGSGEDPSNESDEEEDNITDEGKILKETLDFIKTSAVILAKCTNEEDNIEPIYNY